jgi:hypothetical protein
MFKIYLMVLAVMVASCSPMYIPNVRNSPMFTKGGEFQASVQIGNGLDGQSAFSVTENFALMANYSFSDRSSLNADPDNDSDYHRHTFYEGGLGYFNNDNDGMFFEVFAGYGRGKGSNRDEYVFFNSESVYATGKYNRYFIQPAFGLNSKAVDVSFVSRFSLVDFYEFSTETISAPIDEDPKLFYEPAVVGRGNFANNHMFFTFQGGVSLALSDDIYFHRRAFQVSTGIGFRLGGKKPPEKRID